MLRLFFTSHLAVIPVAVASHFIAGTAAVLSHHEESSVVWCQCGVPGLWTRLALVGHRKHQCSVLASEPYCVTSGVSG